MSVTAAAGFVANGGACGVKPSGAPDLAIVATDDARPVTAAAVFTANKACAAPVQISRSHLASSGGQAAAVVLNSGNANAATGATGREHAIAMCEATATSLGCATEEVLVCSTGLIGIPLPVQAILDGIPSVAAALSASNGGAAATAILTTDTTDKQAVVPASGFTVGGMAKGAAMLAPNMATMLAVLTTDAMVEADVLQESLRHAVSRSFNVLSVDGCTSTNDTVIVLASGRSSTRPSDDELRAALSEACWSLAAQMAGDAEGATKVITVRVTGAASDDEAALAARRVAESQLVKCSFYGQDPYWGRVLSELGSSGAEFDQERASVRYGGEEVCRAGVAVDHDAGAVREHLAGREVQLDCDLGLGDGRALILTNDLTHAYVDENMGTS